MCLYILRVRELVISLLLGTQFDTLSLEKYVSFLPLYERERLMRSGIDGGGVSEEDSGGRNRSYCERYHRGL